MRFASRRQRTTLECLTRFLQGFYTPPELEGRARRVLEKAVLSGGEATYALALAEAISQPGLSHDLRTHTGLLILRQTEGIQEQIARIIDPTELSPQAIDFHAQRRKLRNLVPEDSPVSPDEFADLVLSSVSLVPPHPEFDRRSIATGQRLSRVQVEEQIRIIGEERRRWVDAYSEEAVAYVLHRLRCGSLAAWTDEAGFRAAIEQSPNALAAEFLANLAIHKAANSELAEQACRHACELDPKLAASWNNLGNVLHCRLGRYGEAEQAYRHACELESKDAAPWYNLGNLLMRHLCRYEEAEQAYRHACELDPNDAYPWYGLGNLLMDYLGSPTEAEKAHRKALEIDPAFDPSRHNLIFLLRDLSHDFSAARRLLSELAEPSLGKDTRALHEALFAAYDGNWGVARESLHSALAEVADSLPSSTRDDWYRASAVIVHLGFGPPLLEFLVEQGADVRLMPWFEAVRAHVVGDERHLGNIPAEARAAATEIYAAIDRWKCQLP